MRICAPSTSASVIIIIFPYLNFSSENSDPIPVPKAVIIALHDIDSIILLSHTIKDINSKVKILAKVTKKSVLPDTINSEDFVDIYDCTAEMLVEKSIS